MSKMTDFLDQLENASARVSTKSGRARRGRTSASFNLSNSEWLDVFSAIDATLDPTLKVVLDQFLASSEETDSLPVTTDPSVLDRAHFPRVIDRVQPPHATAKDPGEGEEGEGLEPPRPRRRGSAKGEGPKRLYRRP